MSRDMNDPEIKVNIRTTSREEKEEKKDNSELLSSMLRSLISSTLESDSDVTGYASLQYISSGDSFGDGFYSDIPYLLQAMTIIEPENFTHKNTEIVLDIRNRKCNKSDIGKECAVCLEKVKEGDILTTIDCAHSFHYSCITEWGKYKQECPLCRTRIPILERRGVI